MNKNNYEWLHKNKKSTSKFDGPFFKNPIFKKRTKKTFKITKITLLLSLFVLSLVGCFQGFVVKTNNNTGSGFETYTSKSDIRPRISMIKNNDGFISVDSSVNYNLESKEELKKIHTALKNQGGDITKWRTSNAAVIFDKDVIDNTHAKVASLNGIPVVSSKSVEKAVKQTTILNKTPVYSYEEDPKNKNHWKKTQVVGFWKNPYINWSNDLKINDIQVWNEITYKMNILNSIMQKYTGKQDPFAIPSVKDGGEVNPATKKHVNEYRARLMSAFKTIGAEYSPSNKVNFEKGGIITYASSAELRSISTWGDSWRLGPFYAIFIFPLSKLMLSILGSMSFMYGWETIIAIFAVVVITRFFAWMVSFKSTLQQVKQQEMSAKKATIEAKYLPYKDNKQMQRRKQQEIQEMYKKAGISMFATLGTLPITMPIFISMWRIIASVPHIKSTVWLGMTLPSTSWRELFAGHWQYLWIMVLASSVQIFSNYLPRLLTKRRDKNRINVLEKSALKKANKTQNITLIIFGFMALIWNAGLQIYWIFGGLWKVFETLINHNIIKTMSKRKKTKKLVNIK